MATQVTIHIAQLLSKDTGESVEEARKFAEEHQSDVKAEIRILLKDRAEIPAIVKALFPLEIPINETFYSRLSHVQYCWGSEQDGADVLACVWVEAHKRLTDQQNAVLLNLLPNSQEIFFILPMLAGFLSKVNLSNEFAARWFLALTERISGDLAGGPLYEAMHTFALNSPKTATEILQKYIHENLDDIRLTVSSILLGSLRASVDRGSLESHYADQLKKQLHRHPIPNYRHCYSRSWIGYFREGTTTNEDLFAALYEMLQWTEEDINDAFWVLSRCVLLKTEDSTFLKLALQWLKQNANSNIPPVSKAFITTFLQKLYEKSKEPGAGVTPKEIDDLIFALQPISAEQEHTWRTLQFYMALRLKDDKEAFGNILREIASRAPDILPKQFKEHRFDYLVNRLAQSDPASFITELLLSSQTPEHRLGRALLEVIRITALDQEIVKRSASKESLQILLLEIARKPLLSEVVSRIYLLLLPCYQDADEDLRKEFLEELRIQAINYPGACLDQWKKIENPNSMLSQTIVEAEEYFKNLRSVNSCSGRHITFPEWDRAFKEWSRRFSNEVSEGARKASVLSQFVKHINIPYGSEWSIGGNKALSDPKPMQTLATETEFPRLEILDPEGMSLRRLRINSRLNKLRVGQDELPETNNE